MFEGSVCTPVKVKLILLVCWAEMHKTEFHIFVKDTFIENKCCKVLILCCCLEKCFYVKILKNNLHIIHIISTMLSDRPLSTFQLYALQLSALCSSPLSGSPFFSPPALQLLALSCSLAPSALQLSSSTALQLFSSTTLQLSGSSALNSSPAPSSALYLFTFLTSNRYYFWFIYIKSWWGGEGC